MSRLRAVASTIVLIGLVSCSDVGPTGLEPERDGPEAGDLSVHAHGAGPAVRVSEIHYDNAGADVGEAIEISGPVGTDLTGWQLVLYDGASLARRPYHTTELTQTIPATCGSRGVIVIEYPTDGIDNGREGWALVDADGHVVEFMSYEGSFTAASGPAAGLISTNIGVAETGFTPVGHSLQRNPDGRWSGPKEHTFGECNDHDGSGDPPEPEVQGSANTLTISGRGPDHPPLPVGFEDQLFATLRDGAGDAVPTTITWSSDAPDIASVDARGVVRALAAGTMRIRATADDGTTRVFTFPTRVAEPSTTAAYEGNAEFGEPADADPSDDIVVRRDQYTASYNPRRNIPNWISYNVNATHFGVEDGCRCFTFDPALPDAVDRYSTADYTDAAAHDGHGIARGHLARSFARTAGALDNAVTFYFTNVFPQLAEQSHGPWAAMEDDLGDLARFEDREVYVIAGTAGSVGTLGDEGVITIPAHTWKVAVLMPRGHGLADVRSVRDLDVVAVIMPNVPGVSETDWRDYRTTVNAVEALSGYDLLALLPDAIEFALETGTADAEREVAALLDQGAINGGVAQSLIAKLRAAARSLEAGNTTAGRNQLEAFLREVDALVRSGRLTAEQAAPLRAAVDAVLEPTEVVGA